MPTRRGSRPSHVRPRPPSTGRPAPQRVRVPAPDAYRLNRSKGLDGRRRGIPWSARLLLVIALVALGGAVLVTAGGGVGALIGVLQTSVSGFVERVTATPEPSASDFIASDAPVIASPSEPYTRITTADLQIAVPAVVVGNTAARLRIYVTLDGQSPVRIAEVPTGGTIRMIVPVELAPGRNDFYATIVEAGVESEASPIVTFILDTEPPTFVLTSPEDAGTVNSPTVTVKGTSQARTSLLVRNDTNGTSITGQAGSEGTFSLDLPLEPGPNAIRISGTDPAGNAGELLLTVNRGDGTLTATLSASAYRISAASLPASIQLGVLVLDPDGVALADAVITFNLTVPGIPPISKDALTNVSGRATFTTTLPVGVTAGAGLATVLVATVEHGATSAQKTITIVE